MSCGVYQPDRVIQYAYRSHARGFPAPGMIVSAWAKRPSDEPAGIVAHQVGALVPGLAGVGLVGGQAVAGDPAACLAPGGITRGQRLRAPATILAWNDTKKAPAKLAPGY